MGGEMSMLSTNDFHSITMEHICRLYNVFFIGACSSSILPAMMRGPAAAGREVCANVRGAVNSGTEINSQQF